jgi:quercetin dioxygenase-like cupin family protein
MSTLTNARPSRRSVALTGALGALGALAATTRAFAGVCAADKVGVDVMKPGATSPKGVTDKVIGAIDLAQEKVKLAGYQIRARQLVIQPGGEVPWHSHAERPALIYIVSGTITEFRSTCKDPIVHKGGELAVENHEVSHWWKNTGKTPVVIISFDLFHEAQDPHMM